MHEIRNLREANLEIEYMEDEHDKKLLFCFFAPALGKLTYATQRFQSYPNEDDRKPQGRQGLELNSLCTP